MNSALSYIISNEKQTLFASFCLLWILLLTSHVPSESGCLVCVGVLVTDLGDPYRTCLGVISVDISSVSTLN